MTLDDVLHLAGCVANATEPSDPFRAGEARVLAKWIIKNLGHDQSLDTETPEVYPGEIIITREMVGCYSPDKAMQAARGIIIAAEKARGP